MSEKECPNCSRANEITYRFCIFCGSPLQTIEPEELTKLEEIRKQETDAESKGLLPWRQMAAFFVPLLITAAPVVILSIICSNGYEFEHAHSPAGDPFTGMGYVFLQLIGGIWWVIALVVAIVNTIQKRTRRRTAGIWFGLGIGIVTFLLAWYA